MLHFPFILQYVAAVRTLNQRVCVCMRVRVCVCFVLFLIDVVMSHAAFRLLRQAVNT